VTFEAGAAANVIPSGPPDAGCSPRTNGSPPPRSRSCGTPLIDAGDPGIEILHAYTVKENLRQLLALTGSHPDQAEIRTRLWQFYSQAASSFTPEVHRLAATIEAWWPVVEAAITTGYSNARSEGYNRLFENQRRRIRWACTRQHRRASATTSEVSGQVRRAPNRRA